MQRCVHGIRLHKKEKNAYISEKPEKAYPAEEENKCPKPRKFTL